jgi:hypothetical protein
MINDGKGDRRAKVYPTLVYFTVGQKKSGISIRLPAFFSSTVNFVFLDKEKKRLYITEYSEDNINIPL